MRVLSQRGRPSRPPLAGSNRSSGATTGAPSATLRSMYRTSPASRSCSSSKTLVCWVASSASKYHSSSQAPFVSREVPSRSEEHTSELQSRQYLVCRLLLEKKKHITRLIDLHPI